jgi:hypothetical protein
MYSFNINIMITLLPLAVSLCIPFVRPSLALSNCNETTIHTLDVRDSSSGCDSRTLWNIIWSCAATLFACTWTAIHPNIPGVDEGKLAVTSRRLLIMIMVLVVPELIIAWAARQFFSACDTASEFNRAFRAQQSSATPLTETPRLDDKNSPSLSASKATVHEFTGPFMLS